MKLPIVNRIINIEWWPMTQVYHEPIQLRKSPKLRTSPQGTEQQQITCRVHKSIKFLIKKTSENMLKMNNSTLCCDDMSLFRLLKRMMRCFAHLLFQLRINMNMFGIEPGFLLHSFAFYTCPFCQLLFPKCKDDVKQMIFNA